jgi:hypothetical protein
MPQLPLCVGDSVFQRNAGRFLRRRLETVTGAPASAIARPNHQAGINPKSHCTIAYRLCFGNALHLKQLSAIAKSFVAPYDVADLNAFESHFFLLSKLNPKFS